MPLSAILPTVAPAIAHSKETIDHTSRIPRITSRAWNEEFQSLQRKKINRTSENPKIAIKTSQREISMEVFKPKS
ncbi:hypothetical protein HI914_01564 [Erysiphe necator]|nr:hypothetical protein HI914_01564 [Erysiphe necator]